MFVKMGWLVGLACLLTASSTAAEPATRPPNIVFLLADDLGWTGLGCFGSDLYETPHLDRLAADGMRFTNAYAACTVCSPTRASIMTGNYPARLHLTDFIAGQNRPFARMRIPDWQKGLQANHVTMAEALSGAGYRTALIGKWHLDGPDVAPQGRGPTAHGFDFVATKPPRTSGYLIPPSALKPASSGKKETSKTDAEQADAEPRYLTDFLTDRSLEFIEQAKDDPFFLYFAYHVPHTPIQGRADLVAKFQQRVRDDAVHQNPIYAAMVASLDQSVGRILDRLQQLGLADNTLVVFTSDNGGLTQRYGVHDGFTDNAPLRRGKGSAYEGGVRVPTIVYWPGNTPAGSQCDTPIITNDYYPTLLQVAGVPVPAAGAVDSTIDGRSLVGLWKDPRQTIERDLFWHHPHYHAGGDGPYSAIRSGRWRLIEFHEDDRVELYDLSDDIGESHDLSQQQPEQVQKLRARLHAWRAEVGAQMPTVNPNFDAQRATEVRRPGR